MKPINKNTKTFDNFKNAIESAFMENRYGPFKPRDERFNITGRVAFTVCERTGFLKKVARGTYQFIRNPMNNIDEMYRNMLDMQTKSINKKRDKTRNKLPNVEMLNQNNESNYKGSTKLITLAAAIEIIKMNGGKVLMPKQEFIEV